MKEESHMQETVEQQKQGAFPWLEIGSGTLIGVGFYKILYAVTAAIGVEGAEKMLGMELGALGGPDGVVRRMGELKNTIDSNRMPSELALENIRGEAIREYEILEGVLPDNEMQRLFSWSSLFVAFGIGLSIYIHTHKNDGVTITPDTKISDVNAAVEQKTLEEKKQIERMKG